MTILIFILILVALIIAHEFGHFIVAKLFGIRVDEFGVFFPPRLLAWKRGETTYTLNALPFGGFVKIYGESTADDPSAASNPRSFVAKPRLVQAAVIVAGIVFNLLFAWLVLSAGYMVGIQTPVEHRGVGTVQNPKVLIEAVLPDSPAQKAGLKMGDELLSVETGTGELAPGFTSDGALQFIQSHENESMVLNIERDGQQLNVLAKPADGIVPGHKAIGIQMDDVGILKLSLPLALVQGAIIGKEMTVETAQGLWGFFSTLVRGKADFASVSGPIGIVSLGSSAVKQGAAATIILTAIISINLAIINLIPIPGLDGGRLLFIAIEAATRRPISETLALRLTIAGFALLITLMLVASYHDILHLIHPLA